MARTTATAWSMVICLTAALGACRRPSEKLKLVGGGGETLEIGREIELTPANYGWSFRANPGDTFRVRADWAPGRVKIQVGSDLRDGEDDDDATAMQEEEGTPEGAHRSRAVLKVNPKANVGWIRLSPQGRGIDPIRLRVDRGP
jgi:hypothetical protein